jgi:hypothetical protein
VREWRAPETWFESKSDTLTAIRALAADEAVECIEGEPPDEADLQRVELLTARYRHPLNIAASSEHRVRERLLERLMVADRARIEQNSLQLLNADELLLRLNLVAIYASFTTDLRYLDALNYYYELLPADWHQESRLFLNFYARALATHIS